MRSWLLAALLVLVTLQSAWAAAGRGCLPASWLTAAHPGHPVHQHAAPGDRSQPADQALPCFAGGADCEACHGSCAVVLARLPLMAGPRATAPPAMLALLPPASAPRETPERPQWA